MSDRPALRVLADRVGILPGFTDTVGHYCGASEETLELLLHAMGFDASSEDRALGALAGLDAQDRARRIEPVVVCRGTDPASSTLSLRHGVGGALGYRVEIIAEDGSTEVLEGQGDLVQLPSLTDGYYDLEVVLESLADEPPQRQTRVVHPDTCYHVGRVLHGERRFGISANLYACRSERNWGVGDVGDLLDLIDWAGDMGAAFVGLNPLHAQHNRPPDVSPYLPFSRVFRNPIYIDVTAVPEFAGSESARAILAEPETRRRLEAFRASDRIEYGQVWELKLRVLRALHDAFEHGHGEADPARAAAYALYCRDQADDLETFATCAARVTPGTSVAFHRFVQFELDRQLGDAADRAKRAGLRVGLYMDLAIGSAPGGADAAMDPGLFVNDASLGAPPDAYSASGQDWGAHPLHPLRSKASGYAHWIKVLRANMRHAGALRIDHVMGLDRQYWVPAGREPHAGAYVRYPSSDLFGVVALESHRHETVVIGESLGTLPEGFLERLHGWGILTSQVFYFERSAGGAFHDSAHYSDRSLTSLNTHDVATWAGFWSGRDLDLRRDLDLADVATWERLHSERKLTREAIWRLLAEEGLLDGPDPSPEDLAAAVHAFIGRAASPLIGVSLDDLAGEIDAVNLPGAPLDVFMPWSRRAGRTVAEIRADGLAQKVLAALERVGRVTEARGRSL